MEVLVAIAVLAVAATAALKSGLLAQDGLISARSMDTALVLARDKMEELETRGPENVVVVNGDFAPDFPDIAWEVDIRKTSRDALSYMRLTVTYGLGGDDQVVLERLAWNE
jgi:type II secretory pathway pseudopilin PulG